MDEIDRFTAAIADAVSQQNAAASEISRSIGHAATGTESVARSIAGTATATENTNRSADLVLATARDLSDQAAGLRASVDRFLSNVAAWAAAVLSRSGMAAAPACQTPDDPSPIFVGTFAETGSER
jgi:predicted NACHT family NTPase